MKKIQTIFAVLLFMLATAVQAQQRIVVVTTDGGLFDFPASDGNGLVYDSSTGGFNINGDEGITSFSADAIKQVYFEDKSVLNQDPYVEPKETDTVNPNYEYVDAADYEVLEVDTALCRIKVKFLKEVPQFYVGKILPLQKDDFGCYCYVLTWNLDGQVADIRFRPAPLEELLYNCDLVLSSQPDESYYATNDQVSARRRGELGGKVMELPPVKFVGDMMKPDIDPTVTVETQQTASLETLFAYQSGPPLRGTSGIRSTASEIKHLKLVFTGTYNRHTTLKVELKGEKKVGIERLLEKPVFFTSGGFVLPTPVPIPIWITFSANLGARMEAFAQAEFKYGHSMNDELKVKAGLEFFGEQMELKPIFEFDASHKQDRPDFTAFEGKAGILAGPVVRFDLTVNLSVGVHVDLLPFLRLNYETFKQKADQRFHHLYTDAGLNLRGGLFYPLYKKREDFISYTSDDLLVTKLWEEPKHFVNNDSLKQVWNSYGQQSEWQLQAYAEQDGEQLCTPAGTQGVTVQSQLLSDFPFEEKKAEYEFAERYGNEAPQLNSLDEVKRSGRLFESSRRRAETTGELRPIGEPWTTTTDKDGLGQLQVKSAIPLGYRTVVRNSILDGQGNVIAEKDIEMPWEIRSFNAQLSFAGMEGGSIEYRDGGKYIREVNPFIGVVVLDNGKITVTTVTGQTSTIPATDESMGMLMWSSQMLVNPIEPGAVAGLDETRWAYGEGIMKTQHGVTFSETTYLGLPCHKYNTPSGSMTVFQNLNLKSDTSEGSIVVTKLDILE